MKKETKLLKRKSVWLIEIYRYVGWYPSTIVFFSRQDAREYAKEVVSKWEDIYKTKLPKLRVRQYIKKEIA